MNYVYQRPGPEWVCPTCGQDADRCQMVSEGELMYPSPAEQARRDRLNHVHTTEDGFRWRQNANGTVERVL